MYLLELVCGIPPRYRPHTDQATTDHILTNLPTKLLPTTYWPNYRPRYYWHITDPIPITLLTTYWPSYHRARYWPHNDQFGKYTITQQEKQKKTAITWSTRQPNGHFSSKAASTFWFDLPLCCTFHRSKRYPPPGFRHWRTVQASPQASGFSRWLGVNKKALRAHT